MNRFAIAALLALPLPGSAAAASFAGAVPPQAPSAPRAMPVRFVENVGQWDGRARFHAESAGLDLFVTGDGFVVRFASRVEAPAKKGEKAPAPPLRPGAAVVGASLAFRFGGAAAAVEGEAPLPGLSHYLLGRDPAAWHRNARAFGSVHWRRPGLEARFRDDGGILTYDLQIPPGIAAESLVIECEGADALEVRADGSLVAKTAHGEVLQRAPRSFEVTPSGELRPVASRFRLLGASKFGVEAEGRDLARPLLVDPGLEYSTFVGGTSFESGFALAVDGQGNAYTTGYTSSNNFPTTAGAFDTSYAGNYDAYVVKTLADGSAFEYATYLGGSSLDQGIGIAVDTAGSAYVVGTTLSIDFPITNNAYDTTFGFGTIFGDGFLCKLAADGQSAAYSTYLGGNSEDVPLRVAVDAAFRAHVVGWTRSTDFISAATSPAAFDNTYNGTNAADLGDAFLAKMSANGQTLLYGTLLGGPNGDAASGVGIDSQGDVLVAGLARGGFPTKASPFNTFKGGSDVFVAKFNTGQVGSSSLVWCGLFGGLDTDYANSLAVDASDANYVVGYTESSDFPTKSAVDPSYNKGGSDAFAFKLSPAGDQLGYSTYLGGKGWDEAISVVVDGAAVASVVGKTTSNNYFVTPGTIDPSYNGGLDGFVTRIASSGSSLLFSTYVGGSGDEEIAGVGFAAGGTVLWVTGTTLSPKFTTTPGAIDTTYSNQDAFLMKIDAGPAPLLCLDNASAIQVPFAIGGNPPAPVVRSVSNCGSNQSTLSWSVSELVDAPWLSIAPGSGSVAQGAAAAAVSCTFDPTGLAQGAYQTTLRFQNDGNPNDFTDVPVLFAVQELVIAPFVVGDGLVGEVEFPGEIDWGTFSGVKGETFKFKIATISNDLAPLLSLLDQNGVLVWQSKLKHNTTTVSKSVKLPSDGTFQLVIADPGATSGGYSFSTSSTLPADAKKFTKKNQAPKTDGAPVDFLVRLIAGATFDFASDPVSTVSGTFAITLLDPAGAPVDVSAFSSPYGNGGLQITGVPAATAGQYTIRVTGPLTKKEKVNATFTPAQPLGTSAVELP